MPINWQQAEAAPNIWRAQLDGRTVAAIILDGTAATIVAADRHGRETRAAVIGDTLDENKQTARTMLEGAGWQL